MGVTQPYYRPFGSWLAGQGFRAVTFDYRGVGASRREPLRRVDADIRDWAATDCTAMIDALAEWTPGRPLYWIGHSLGAQILGFAPNRDRLSGAVAVASGSGYWRETAPGLMWRAWWLWFVVAPIAMSLCGYFPGRRLRKVGDLPKGVMRQWRRWCLHPEYAVGVEGQDVRASFASVTLPLASLSFTDDEFMSERNTASLLGFYSAAPKTVKRFRPADLGVRRVGHFGFFRPAFEEVLWRPHLLPLLA
jgi:predicted alpha/beta hydrolase